VAAVVLLLLVRFVLPKVWPEGLEYSVLGGVAGGLLVVLWWLLFSRAPWVDRLGAIVLMAAALAGTKRLLDPSIAKGGMGFLYFIYAVPLLGVVFVAAAAVGRKFSDGARRVTMAAAILVACGFWTLLRSNGFNADAISDFAWRWSPTAEEKLLAKPAAPLTPVVVEKIPEPVVEKVAAPMTAKPVTAVVKTAAEWPGFRGPKRDGVVPGTRIETDWSRTPPVEMWRKPVGPGWSSFAVRGDLFYTQEQRGSDEVVSCYRMTTGDPVWRHGDVARFWEANAGAGPRATPTLSKGRVYTFGATGIANALDAESGAVIWSRNAAADAGMKIPDWGFASSPLVVGDRVIVAAAGKLAAYDVATGEPKWYGPDGGVSYSSPQLATIGEVPQVLLLGTTGLTSVALDGTPLWKHAWAGYPIVQPGLTPEGDVLISVSDRSGTRRLSVGHGEGWTVEERWTSAGLKPYFNDFVVHKDHAFGFDGGILSCIDLKDGKRVWKGGRYGHGQLILLPDQDLLLVLSEEGELALVEASMEQFKELAKIPAVEGKTWNHPVLVGDVLLVRNGQEMAAFRLR
jgi:outer membrane protein assembly factor BamB